MERRKERPVLCVTEPAFDRNAVGNLDYAKERLVSMLFVFKIL